MLEWHALFGVFRSSIHHIPGFGQCLAYRNLRNLCHCPPTPPSTTIYSFSSRAVLRPLSNLIILPPAGQLAWSHHCRLPFLNVCNSYLVIFTWDKVLAENFILFSSGLSAGRMVDQAIVDFHCLNFFFLEALSYF